MITLSLLLLVSPAKADPALSEAFGRAQAVLAQPAATTAPAAPATQPGKPVKDPQALTDLLDRVSASAKAGVTPLVLFDLDDTLFDTAPRTVRILKEFAADPASAKYPQAAGLAGLTSAQVRFSLVDTARAAGVTDPATLDEMTKFWAARFFDNAYLPEDAANPGAVDFVKTVVARGGVPVYFTGRWEAMRPGTEAALKKAGFPAPDGKTVRLEMKPDRKIADDVYKDQRLPELGKLGEVVGGFENEPANVNIFKQRFPSGTMIFVDTRHSDKKDPATGQPFQPRPDVLWVDDFRRP
jgi:hypothetical protein